MRFMRAGKKVRCSKKPTTLDDLENSRTLPSSSSARGTAPVFDEANDVLGGPSTMDEVEVSGAAAGAVPLSGLRPRTQAYESLSGSSAGALTSGLSRKARSKSRGYFKTRLEFVDSFCVSAGRALSPGRCSGTACISWFGDCSVVVESVLIVGKIRQKISL